MRRVYGVCSAREQHNFSLLLNVQIYYYKCSLEILLSFLHYRVEKNYNIALGLEATSLALWLQDASIYLDSLSFKISHPLDAQRKSFVGANICSKCLQIGPNTTSAVELVWFHPLAFCHRMGPPGLSIERLPNRPPGTVQLVSRPGHSSGKVKIMKSPGTHPGCNCLGSAEETEQQRGEEKRWTWGWAFLGLTKSSPFVTTLTSAKLNH